MHWLVVSNFPLLFRGSHIISTQTYSLFHFLQHNQILSYACFCKREKNGSSFLKDDIYHLVDYIIYHIYIIYNVCELWTVHSQYVNHELPDDQKFQQLHVEFPDVQQH